MLSLVVILSIRAIYNYLKNDDDEETNISFSNPHNNHDHNKVAYSSRQSAQREVSRMQSTGLDRNGRLNEYYNRERKAWFVGRSNRDY